jgi:hypothetical protein
MVARNVVVVPDDRSTLDAAVKFVKSKGARRKIGEGCYGAVWASNEGKRGAGNRVYKICATRANEFAYLAYAAACADELKGNPHVPRIYSIVEFKSTIVPDPNVRGRWDKSSYTVICMEKLQPVGDPMGNPLNGCCYKFNSDEHLATMCMMHSAVFDGTNEEHFNPKMFKVLKVIGRIQRANDRNIDIHSGNVMLRGNTLVVTDPLS